MTEGLLGLEIKVSDNEKRVCRLCGCRLEYEWEKCPNPDCMSNKEVSCDDHN